MTNKTDGHLFLCFVFFFFFFFFFFFQIILRLRVSALTPRLSDGNEW